MECSIHRRDPSGIVVRQRFIGPHASRNCTKQIHFLQRASQKMRCIPRIQNRIHNTIYLLISIRTTEQDKVYLNSIDAKSYSTVCFQLFSLGKQLHSIFGGVSKHIPYTTAMIFTVNTVQHVWIMDLHHIQTIATGAHISFNFASIHVYTQRH